MTDEQKCLEWLKHRRDQTPMAGAKRMFGIAISALEKRTPKRDMQKNQYNHNLFSVRCPSCSAHLGTYNKRLNQFTYTHFEWCPYCGQAIDWSEPNTE